MNCSDGQIPPNKLLLNQHGTSHGRHVNVTKRKSLEVQAQSQNQQSNWSENLYKL